MKTIDFTVRLKEIRDVLGLTQKEIAEKLGCSRASYAYYETGKNTPDINFLKNLHDLTDLPFDYLLGYSNNTSAETIDVEKKYGLSTKSCKKLELPNNQITINRILESDCFDIFNFYVQRYNLNTAVTKALENAANLPLEYQKIADIIKNAQKTIVWKAAIYEYITKIFDAKDANDYLHPMKTVVDNAQPTNADYVPAINLWLLERELESDSNNHNMELFNALTENVVEMGKLISVNISKAQAERTKKDNNDKSEA